MATTSQSAPSLLTPGNQTSEHAIAWAMLVLGALISVAGLALSVLGHPQGMLLVGVGLKVAGATAGSYAMLRSGLKVIDMWKRAKPIVDVAEPIAEHLLPTGAQSPVHLAFGLAEKALDVLSANAVDPGSPGDTPPANPAPAVLAEAKAAPIAPPGSPSSPGAA